MSTPVKYRYPAWLYRPLIRAVLSKAGVKPGMSALDCGCGFGQFAGMMSDEGLRVIGMDTSTEAVEQARRDHPECIFWNRDSSTYDSPLVDLVFCRAFSGYNKKPGAVLTDNPTLPLLSCLKPGGVLIWMYPSRLRPHGCAGWRWHTLPEAMDFLWPHRVYFTTRIECLLFGALSFNPLFTRIASTITRLTGIGGELVAVIRKP